MFRVEKSLQQYLELDSDVKTRKEIQSAFILKAIEGKFVDQKAHVYEVHKVPYLHKKF